MPKGYIQLGASCSSPSICPARATGCTTDHYGTNIGPVSKELPQLKSNNGGDAYFICSNEILIL